MRYLFIISNTIRTKELQKLEDVISSLGEEQRNSIELRYVQYQGHAMDLATEASDQYDDKVTVVAVGGDKIVHEIVNALAYRSTPLIILPMGTYNDFAGSVYPEYVMKNPAAMVKRLGEVKFSPIDLVRLDSYDVLGNHLPVWSGFFINVATIGFDTQLANTGTDLAAKKGKDYNASKACVKGLRSATQKLRPYKLDYNFELVDSDTNEISQNEIFNSIDICNSKSVNGGFIKAPDASITDGVLDICVTEFGSKLNTIQTQLKTRKKDGDVPGNVRMFKATSGIITCKDNSYQLNGCCDGELFYGHRIRFEVFPEALIFGYFPDVSAAAVTAGGVGDGTGA